MSKVDFCTTFKVLTGNPPFPWQEALYERFAGNAIPSAASIPTGLGKTNVIAIWLIALANAAKVPRRLVYVVNRRTVVDQTTAEVEKIRSNIEAAGIAGPLRQVCGLNGDEPPLAISTLRGQFADNREWSADPSRPAVICGTVDMIGSRLLFSGYGIGFKSRPLHAGFLGQDVLLVHDEAHLEPAFQKLIETIQREQAEGERTDGLPLPKLRVMALSATTRNSEENGESDAPWGLTPKELDPPDELPDPPTEPIHHVWRRLKAKKVLTLHSAGDGKDAVAKEIAKRAAAYKDSNAAVLVFVRTLDDVDNVKKELAKTKRNVILLTGTMRGKERDELVEKPEFKRFLKGAGPGETVYLVCTSAGEVGVDISADHMVCDLSTFESMAQRFGRVNRYGEPSDHMARIDVVHPASFGKIDKRTSGLKADEVDKRRQRTLELLKLLPSQGEDLYDASPKALGELQQRLDLLPRKIEDAFAPEPTILPATDILFDAWSLTTIREPMPGRPEIGPYLHGVAEWQPPETYVAWREEVGIINDELLELYRPEDLLDDYPLKPHELVRNRSDRVFKHLEGLVKRLAETPVWILDARGAVEPTTLSKLITSLGQLKASDRDKRLNDCTILLPPSAGGLSCGMLDGESKQADDAADQWSDEHNRPRRMRVFSDDRKPDGPADMALIRTIDTNPDADEIEPAESESSGEEEEGATARRGRFWHWYARPRDAEDATRASLRPVSWNDHTGDVVQRTTQIVNALNLPSDLKQAVILAAELHDLGKQREQWQRGIGNPNPAEWYAKPGKPENGPRWRPQYLTPYRHEFGSLLDALDENGPHAVKLAELSPDMKDLVLHLVAAHHGRARPHFDLEEAFDPKWTSSSADALAVETPRRFARLQRKYGRWSLAYLESLLRAADWAASAAPSSYANDGGPSHE